MGFTSGTIGHTILLKPQLFCKSARTSPALGCSYVGNFALNSPFNGKKHGREAKEHKSCKLLFWDQPELALKWRHCMLLAAVFSFGFQQVVASQRALEGKKDQPVVNPVVRLVWGSFLQKAKLCVVLWLSAFVLTELFILYLSPLFLAPDQASHLLVIEFLSADSTAGEGLRVTWDASISQQTAH